VATLAEHRSKARSLLARQVSSRFITDQELNGWLNEALVELVQELKFLRKFGELTELDKITSLGTDPTYYQLQSDFIDLAPKSALKMNGLTRVRTDEREYYRFQEIELGSTSDVSSDDFFRVMYNGVIFHYSKEYYYADEVEASRTGRLAYFIPNLSNGWETASLAIGETYTAASFVCDTGAIAGNPKGHFEDAIGARITLGEGNHLPQVAAKRRVQLTIAGVDTDFYIKAITDDGEQDNEVELETSTLPGATYVCVQINRGAIQYKYVCHPANMSLDTDVPQMPAEDGELLAMGACIRASNKLEARNPKLRIKSNYEADYARLLISATKKYGLDNDDELKIYPYKQWTNMHNSQNSTEITFTTPNE